MSAHPDSLSRFHIFLILSFFGLLTWSAIAPRDRFTWWLEVAPALIGFAVLCATFRQFQFTPLAYSMIWLHAAVLLVGGHYTYAEVPLFNWLRDLFHLSRNHFDRVGHIAQGFFPAIVVREILIRCSPLKAGKWLFFLTCCVCLSISALYELIEWVTALATGEKAEAFLGTQGDCWDTQWDMFLALCGVITAQVAFSSFHDIQLSRLNCVSPHIKNH